MTVEPGIDPPAQPVEQSAIDVPAQPPAPAYAVPPQAAPAQYHAYQPVPANAGQIGKVRGTGVCILLAVVTLGIYPIIWYYQTHEEMKRHSGQGLGGGIALVLALFVGIAMPYLSSGEVGGLPVEFGAARGLAKASGQVVGRSLTRCLPALVRGSVAGCVAAGHRPGGSWLKRGLLRSR